MSHEYMPGTDPESEYLVIARAHDVKLGVRPLLKVVVRVDKQKRVIGYGIHLGVRLRAVSDTGAHLPTAVPAAFPKVPFQKVKKTHASAVLGSHAQTDVWDRPLLESKLGEAIHAMHRALQDMGLGSSMICGVGPMRAYLESQFLTLIEAIESEIEESKGKGLAQGTSKVVPFKAPDDNE